MPSKESTAWLNTLSVLAVVGSALYMLYVGSIGAMPAVLGFKNGFVLVAAVQLFAGISLMMNDSTLADLLDEFKGTRQVRVLSAGIFLALGVYNLALDPGTSTLWIGIPFTVLGSYMLYTSLVVPNSV